MALSYEVHRAFARGGVYYTRQNADDIRSLSRKERDDLIGGGYITEHTTATAAEPAAPAPSGKEK
jgi:hypothetical protein